MADPMPPPRTSEGVYAHRLGECVRRLRELEAPSGTQRAQTMGDLLGRSTHVATPAAFQQIQGAVTGQKGPAIRALSFPGPRGGARSGILILSGIYQWTGSTTGSGTISDSVRAVLQIVQAGQVIWSDLGFVESEAMMPAASGRTVSAVATAPIPALERVEFELRLYTSKSWAGGQANAGARVTNLVGTLLYGDRL